MLSQKPGPYENDASMQSHDSWLKSVKGNFHGIQFLPFHHHPFLSPHTPPSFIEFPSIASLYMRVSHQPPSPSPASRHVAERLAPLSTKTPYWASKQRFANSKGCERTCKQNDLPQEARRSNTKINSASSPPPPFLSMLTCFVLTHRIDE